MLDALRTERLWKDRWYNLVVAATGTGKTAISAFDYRNFYRTGWLPVLSIWGPAMM